MEFEDENPPEVFPEPEMGVCTCDNPYCPDYTLERSMPLGSDSYWCGTCGVRMTPPREATEPLPGETGDDNPPTEGTTE